MSASGNLPGMAMLVTADGRVAYKRQEGGMSKSIEGPLEAFEGDNLIVGVGPIKTTFVVSAPPHLEQGRWKMTVDGVELTRKE